MWKVALIVTAGVLTAAAIGQMTVPATQAAKVPFSISKETTAITGPLRVDGTVDYIAALNEKYGKGVTPENNAYVLFLQVTGTGDEVIAPIVRENFLKLLGAKPSPADADVLVPFADFLLKTTNLRGESLDAMLEMLRKAPPEPWRADERPELAAYLKSFDKHLTLVERAVERPCWWLPTVIGPEGPFIVLPTLAIVRDIGCALIMRGALRIEAGDFEGFLADEMAAKKLARHMLGGTTFLERLVGAAIDRRATQAIAAAVAGGKRTEGECKRLVAELAKLSRLGSLVEPIDIGERFFVLDLTSLMAAKGAGSLQAGLVDSELRAMWGAIDRTEVDWDLVLRRINKTANAYAAALQEKETAKMIQMAKEVDALFDDKIAEGVGESLKKKVGESREAYSERVARTVFVTLFISKPWKAEILRRWEIMENEMLEAVVAAGIFKARNGRWPERLEQLTPELLKEVPKDIHAAQNVKYVVSPRGILLYSIGQNGQDDQGERDLPNGKDDIAIGLK